jgi:photosystem II stability/assembly factor-like uncharacterized protein
MKNRYLLTAFLSVASIFMPSAFLSAQWTSLPDYNGHVFNKIIFPTDLVGYGWAYQVDSAQSFIVKTTDGGNAWTHLFPAQGLVMSMHFSHPDTGILIQRIPNPFHMSVLKTHDGGNNWTEISPVSPTQSYGSSVGHVISGSRIHLSIDENYYRSTDGGTTWDSIPHTGYYFQSMEFADADHGMAGLSDFTFFYSGGVAYTMDAGSTVSLNEFNTYQSQVEYLSYPEISEAYCLSNVLQIPTLHRSTDGGISWDSISISGAGPFDGMSGLEFIPGGEGYFLSGLGKVERSTDYGVTWTEDRPADSLQLRILTQSPGKIWASSANSGVVVMRDITLSINPSHSQPSLKAFPNPVSSGATLTIHFPKTELNGRLKMIDPMGRVVHTWHGLSGEQTLRMPELSEGIYYLQSDGFLTTKIVLRQ